MRGRSKGPQSNDDTKLKVKVPEGIVFSFFFESSMLIEGGGWGEDSFQLREIREVFMDEAVFKTYIEGPMQ